MGSFLSAYTKASQNPDHLALVSSAVHAETGHNLVHEDDGDDVIYLVTHESDLSFLGGAKIQNLTAGHPYLNDIEQTFQMPLRACCVFSHLGSKASSKLAEQEDLFHQRCTQFYSNIYGYLKSHASLAPGEHIGCLITNEEAECLELYGKMPFQMKAKTPCNGWVLALFEPDNMINPANVKSWH